jgi:hypothetical protein
MNYFAQKDFAEGKTAWVVPLTFGRARIIYGPIEAQWVENAW